MPDDDGEMWLPPKPADVGPKDDEEDERPVAVLWLFDPEQPHWMREYYVKREKPKKPAKRKLGYPRKDS